MSSTAAERMRKVRARKRKKGLVKVEYWLTQEDKEAVDAFLRLRQQLQKHTESQIIQK